MNLFCFLNIFVMELLPVKEGHLVNKSSRRPHRVRWIALILLASLALAAIALFATMTGSSLSRVFAAPDQARSTVMTAYRQDAIRLLHHLGENGPCKASDAAKATGVEKARNIMADDHYGWFERVERGIYGVTPKGIDAIALYSEANQG